MLASRLASDWPAHVLYPYSHEAIPEHTTAHRTAAIARPARAEAAQPIQPCRGIPRYHDESLPPYKGFMTTPRKHEALSVRPEPTVAGSFVQGLAAQDFAELGGTLAGGACMRALLPSGLREWTGAEAIAHRFARWFGDTKAFELVEGTVGEVGGRLHLHWRLRLQAERLGPGWFTVEQQAYADTDDSGRIAGLDLLCTGYLPEGDHD
jgi:hypothetical protein